MAPEKRIGNRWMLLENECVKGETAKGEVVLRGPQLVRVKQHGENLLSIQGSPDTIHVKGLDFESHVYPCGEGE